MKTPEEINRINAEFWARRQEKFAEQCEKHPARLDVSARRATKLVQAGMVADPDFLGDTSVEAAMAKSSSQSEAASNPRPKKKPTLKSEFQAAMAKAKREGLTLGEFIESAKEGSIDGIELSEHESGRYVIDAAAVDGDKEKKAHETLKSWWKGELPG